MLKKYLVKNGTILDVLNGSRKQADILVENGIVRLICPGINEPGAEVLNAEGLTITTGWVDDHAHFYNDTENNIGVSASRYLLPFGTTYAIDPGTAGADNYEDFRRRVFYRTDLRYRSYLNVSRIGVPIYGYDLTDMENLEEDACKSVFRKYRGELIGLKARITSNMCADPLRTLRTIRALADELETTFCIHATRCDLSTETILSFFQKGDMLTHCYARTSSGILDEDGTVKRCVWEARDRGVIFDVGHGINSFTFATAEKAIAQGFLADSLSTDLHVSDVSGPVFDMPTTLSKLLTLGVDLTEALRMITVNPVKNLKLTDKSLRIEEGCLADFTVFSLEEGAFSYVDCDQAELTGPYRINAVFTCLGNKVYTPTRVREPNRKIGAAALAEREQNASV